MGKNRNNSKYFCVVFFLGCLILILSLLGVGVSQAGWVKSTVDSTGNVGRYTSIAIDSHNKVHISYYDDTNSSLKYVTNASLLWITSTIDFTGDVGKYSSIAVTSASFPDVHISYYDESNQDLKYATDTSGSWVTSTIDSTGDVGWYTSIALDSYDSIHVSYYYNPSPPGDLKYATKTIASPTWATTTVDSAGVVGFFTSIAIDSNDKVHISYWDTTNGALKYATNASGSWATSTIASGGLYTSIAIDSNDKVHISYSSAGLRYVTNASGSWVTTPIDSSETAETSIAIDSNNKVHISYCDATSYPFNYRLRYANNVSGSWVTSTIDSVGSGGGVGRYNSIAIDSNDNVHISYHDETNQHLKYATNVASDLSMAVTDAGTSTLRYGSWSPGGPPSGTFSGLNSIGGSSSHSPAMAFFMDRQYMAVKGATNDNIYIRYQENTGNWTAWTILSGGTSASPALASFNGKLYLFVKGATNNNIYYRSMDTSGVWSSWTVLPGQTSEAPALCVFNPFGPYRLYAFVKGTNNNLYYRSMDTSGNWDSSWTVLSGQTTKSPACGAIINPLSISLLYVFVKGATNNNIYYRAMDNYATWGAGWSVFSGTTSEALSVAVIPEMDQLQLYVSAKGATNNNAYVRSMNRNFVWGDWTMVPANTNKTPVLGTSSYYNYNP